MKFIESFFSGVFDFLVLFVDSVYVGILAIDIRLWSPITALLLYFAGLAIEQSKRKEGDKSSRLALTAEFEHNKKALSLFLDDQGELCKQYFATAHSRPRIKNVNFEGVEIKIKYLCQLLSTEFYRQSKYDKLQKTGLPKQIIQVYANIQSINGLVDKNKEKKTITMKEYRKLLFLIFITNVQCEFILARLNDKDFLSSSVDIETLIQPLNFYHSNWNLPTEFEVVVISAELSWWERLMVSLSKMAEYIKLGDLFLNNIESFIRVPSQPRELAEMLGNITNNEIRRNLIKQYEGIRKIPD